MMIRSVIVDDEELSRRGIRTRLKRAADVEVVAECCNGREAIQAIRRTSPDLVFLDVQMPGKTGFDVIEAAGWRTVPHIIFVTAHDRYAIRAFEIRALDYLLKPIDDERFDIALQRAREALACDRDSDLGRRFADALSGLAARESKDLSTRPERIVVRSGGRVVFVKTAELDWIEAAGDYVMLHAGKKSWLHRETISGMETQLECSGFARIHRSTLVNLERVSEMRSLDNGEYRVLLHDGVALKLSRNYRQAVQRLSNGHV